ncbi:MAG: RNA polymerase sigma factor [Acidimicrobiales bacterium]
MDLDYLDPSLEAARDGDQSGIAALYRALNPPLVRYLRHQAPDVAEDLASETWMAAAQGLGRFSGQTNDFRAWLYTIARRRVVDHYRRQGRRPRLVAMNVDVDYAQPGDVAQTVLDGISAQQAVTALARDLSAEQAEVVHLRVLGDLSVDEVARIMDRSAGSVRVLQHRALRRLAQVRAQEAVAL